MPCPQLNSLKTNNFTLPANGFRRQSSLYVKIAGCVVIDYDTARFTSVYISLRLFDHLVGFGMTVGIDDAAYCDSVGGFWNAATVERVIFDCHYLRS